MSALDHWVKADALNVFQIALLLERIDPAPLERLGYHGLPEETQDRTTVHLVKVKNAIRTGTLRPALDFYDSFGDQDWALTLIDISSLKNWLWLRGIAGTVFGDYAPSKRAPSQKFSRFHAPKLAAGNAAWEAVTADPKRLRGKSAKQALEEWLTANASEYGLLNKDGTPNKTGIEEIAKVANWNPKGGAPATPTLSEQPASSFGQTPSKVVESPALGFGKWGDDDEVPF